MSLKKVVVAMSGGVDSSLTAFLLKQDGYEVTGIHMKLASEPEYNIPNLERTCQCIGIPLIVLKLETEFKGLVIDYFCREYSRGRTPNPCVVCNRKVKFGLLMDTALEMGADFLATGHYVRVEHNSDGYCLVKAVDQGRDQTYFLYTLGQADLARVIFPLGNRCKPDVRKQAAEVGLPTANMPKSHDACFIPNNDYRAFLAQRVRFEPGEIVDAGGKVLGKHSGLGLYTIGQRHGLGLASNEPLYVGKLDASRNQVVVGPRDQLLSKTLIARDLRWMSGVVPPSPLRVTAKIRYKSPEAVATVSLKDGLAELNFEQAQWAVTPGQSVVFYQEDRLLGGGIIEGTANDTDLN